MNLPVIFSKIGPALKGAAGSGALLAKKYAPEIMIGAGIAGFGATIAATVKATNKTNEIIETKAETIRHIEMVREGFDEGEYTDKDYEKDRREAMRRARWGIVRAWTPVATLGGASVISVLGGYRILNGRYVATAAAYKVLENGFERYRGNVVEKFGKDTDWEMMHGYKAEELEAAQKEQEENRAIDAENRHKKFRKKRKKTAYSDIYSFVFDENSSRWQRSWNADQVLHFLRTVENEMNDLVMLRGYAFVNEANDRLGKEWTPEGQVTGWLRPPYNGTKPMKKIVDFGLDDMPEEELRKILGTYYNCDIRVPIRIEPDGLIYNMIGKTYGE